MEQVSSLECCSVVITISENWMLNCISGDISVLWVAGPTYSSQNDSWFKSFARPSTLQAVSQTDLPGGRARRRLLQALSRIALAITPSRGY
jgi:hypothetical protein